MSDDVVVASLGDELGPLPAPHRKPRIWTLFVAVVLATLANFGFSILAVVILILVAVAGGASIRDFMDSMPEKLMTPWMFMAFIVCGGVAYGLGAIVPAWLSPTPVWERLGLLPVKATRGVYLLAMFASIAPLAIALALAQALALIVPPDPMVELLYKNMTPAAAVPFVLSIAIVPGISEELMFRGYVQRRLLERWSPLWAIGVTSLMFAVVHVQPHTVVAAFPLGLWLGFLAWRCDSIGPSILCHAFINGSLNAWRMVVKFGEVPQIVQTVFEIGCVLVGLVCFVALLRRFSEKGAGDGIQEANRDPEIIQ